MKNVFNKVIRVTPNILFILVVICFFLINLWLIYFYGKELLFSDDIYIDFGKGGIINKYYRICEYLITTPIYIYVFTKIYKKIFNSEIKTSRKYLWISLCAVLGYSYLLIPTLTTIFYNLYMK